MNSFFKKQIAAFLSAAVAFTTFAAGGVFAADLSSLAKDVGYAYGYVDSADTGAITNANAAALKLAASDVTDSRVDALMTDEFVANYDSRKAAKEALVSLLAKSLSVYYSTSAEKLESNLKAVQADMEDVLATIEIDVADWADLMIKTREDAKSLAGWDEKIIWAVGSASGNTDSTTALYETMDSLQVTAMNKRLGTTDYADAKAAFDTLGWTAETVVAACRAVTVLADAGKSAEFALIKAAARSGTEVFVDETKMDVGTKGVNWGSNVVKISPDDLPMTKGLQIKVIGDVLATNFAGFSTSNEELVTIEADDASYEIVVTINEGKKGEADIIIKRDPKGDNSGSDNDWIVRQKIVVAYDIAKAAAPVWGTDADAGKLTWTAVEHAAEYEVVIYRDGTEVARETVTGATAFDANSVFAANGNGNYTATVTAKGDIAAEVGETSDASSSYAYQEALDAVAKPVWTDKTLSWKEVEDATKYIVYLYMGTSTEPFDMIEVIGATSYDAAEKLAGKTGSIYAAVQAKNDTLVGAVSEKSDALVLINAYEVTGKVTLESFQGIQEDNSGIKVSVKELPGISTETDAEGNYTLEKIPDGEYTLVFENAVRYYLKKYVDITVEGGKVTVDDAVMYFGDMSSLGGVMVNIFDLSKILPKIGAMTGDNDFDANMDVDNDGNITQRDTSVVLRNFGKKPTDK
ncbi:MAG: carboxypeptidase regulatory-like domain-containing protein [Clostridia bacterium]|nr:carboxypeptidase regulatory-like domain-containing protein [Clostridia bacterium]